MKIFFCYLHKGETIATVLFMVMFTVMGLLQVIFRLVLHHTLSWSEEACRYLFIWSTMLGAVLVSSENGHFKVDLLVSLLPQQLHVVFHFIAYVLIALFSYILIRYGYQLMMSNTTRISPALGIKMTYIYSVFVINGVLVLIHLLESLYNDFAMAKGGKADA